MRQRTQRIIARTIFLAAAAISLAQTSRALAATRAEARDSGAATTQPATRPAGITYAGGDGTSLGAAVVILGAEDEMAGVQAESTWIRKNHPGWVKGNQALLNKNGRHYDRIDYATPAGAKTIYFDITDFFGKF